MYETFGFVTSYMYSKPLDNIDPELSEIGKGLSECVSVAIVWGQVFAIPLQHVQFVAHVVYLTPYFFVYRWGSR